MINTLKTSVSHAQIVGSFVILNGTINALKYVELPTSIPTAF